MYSTAGATIPPSAAVGMGDAEAKHRDAAPQQAGAPAAQFGEPSGERG
jgi:hypothetical protein